MSSTEPPAPPASFADLAKLASRASLSVETLRALLPLLRQLRDIKGVRETRPGSFTVRGVAFVDLREIDGAPFAELKKAGASGVDRYRLGTPAEQRKLVDDAKRRATALEDE